MAQVIPMPLLSDTMKEGVIAAWHKKVGDTVKSGDLLAEIETDKATMDFEAPLGGTLLFVGIEAGGAVAVGSPLAIIGKAGEDISGLTGGGKAAAAPVAAVEAAPVAEVVAAPAVVATSSSDDRMKASPLAKAIAREKGIDLSAVAGSGEGGRIVKRDIEALATTPVAAAPAVSTTVAAPAADASYEEVRTSQMRKTIARRLLESKNGAPHFYVSMEINMDKAIAAREALNQLSSVKISFNDLVIKACAVALRKHPRINSSWLGDSIRINHDIHIGMAVSVEDGLLVPVIRHTDRKGLAQIAEESKSFALRARNKELQPKDWEGNTFTISNLGMMGVSEFTAIINPPDACILAVAGIQKKPIVNAAGEIVVGNTMKVTLSSDHRVVDGMLAAEFLQTLKGLLEEPMRLMI